MCHDRERVRRELEQSREDAVNELRAEREEILSRHDREREQWQGELAAAVAERESALVNAESERQQLLSLNQQEKNALHERANAYKDELARVSGEFEKSRREFALKHEHDRNHLLSVQDEIKRIRTQFEESIANHEKEIKVRYKNIIKTLKFQVQSPKIIINELLENIGCYQNKIKHKT